MVQNNFCSTCTICDMGQPPHPSGQVTFACHLPRDKFCKKYLSDPASLQSVLDPQKDGSQRPILNLKNLNQFATYQHFKIESLQSDVQLIQRTIGWQYLISRMLTILHPLTQSTESISGLSLKILYMFTEWSSLSP